MVVGRTDRAEGREAPLLVELRFFGLIPRMVEFLQQIADGPGNAVIDEVQRGSVTGSALRRIVFPGQVFEVDGLGRPSAGVNCFPANLGITSAKVASYSSIALVRFVCFRST